MEQEHSAAYVITFGHGARHLHGTGLSQIDVESAIRFDIQAGVPKPSERIVKGFVTVYDRIIVYHAYVLPDGRIHVGTYFPVT